LWGRNNSRKQWDREATVKNVGGKMLRKIVKIDESKCNGCGLCTEACHEGALKLIDGKAKLISDSYCDGLGACLPDCPEGAITIEEREAVAFDESLIQKHSIDDRPHVEPAKPAGGCPGSHAKVIDRVIGITVAPTKTARADSQLRQWPCQIKLVPINAPYLDNAALLIAADCTAYAYPNIHSDFMRNKITLIGCPKLDDVNYAEKLTAILKSHEIKTITILRMEVPCCGGIVNAVKQALADSGKIIPWQVVTIGTDGGIVEV
jgi:ferredoxin